MTMSNRKIEEMFGQWQTADSMCDSRQAEYDYEGAVPVNEDPADWQKPKRIGAIKVG